MRSKRSLIAIVALLAMLGAVALLNPVYTHLRCDATATRVEHDLRAMTHRIFQSAESPEGLPPTFHILAIADTPFYPSIGESACTGRNASNYSFGEFVCDDILAGHVGIQELRAVAQAEGVSNQTWEHITGCWFSREIDAYRSRSSDVLVAINRQQFPQREAPDFFLGTADGIVKYFARNAPAAEVEAVLSADRHARERLGLAPLPNEFSTWLLTGESTSVGNGTFVPLRLNARKDE